MVNLARWMAKPAQIQSSLRYCLLLLRETVQISLNPQPQSGISSAWVTTFNVHVKNFNDRNVTKIKADMVPTQGSGFFISFSFLWK